MSDTEKLRAFCFDLADLMDPLRMFRINVSLRNTRADALANLYQVLGLLEHMTTKCNEVVEYDEEEQKRIKSVVEFRGFIDRELERRD